MIYCESCGRAAATADKVRHETLCKDPTRMASTEGAVSLEERVAKPALARAIRDLEAEGFEPVPYGVGAMQDVLYPLQERGKDRYAEAARKQLAYIQTNRDRLCEAWIAETGLKPSESVLVERRMEDGSVRVWVERRREEDEVKR